MKTKLTTLLAIGLCGLCFAVVATSCKPSSSPSSAPKLSATSQPSPPPGVFGPTVDATTQITQADLTAPAPLIPIDLYRPASDAIDHAQAAKFAWLEFIALVSPNKPSPTRGVPGGSFSSVKGGSSSTYPLVWETYQHRSELFPYNGSDGVTPPQQWDSTPKYAYNPQPSPSPGADYTLFNNLDEASQIFQNNLFFPVNGQAFEVLFEAKGNQLENQYVANNYPLPHPLADNPATLYDNTIEIKAAWRPVASIDPTQLYRYHVANVITYSGDINNPVAENEKYALIALHIIHKTKNYPSFIYATFEQVDDYVNRVTNQQTGVYFQTLYKGAGAPPNPPSGYQLGSYYFATDPSGFSADGTQPTASSFTATTNPTRVFDVNNPLAWPNGNQYKSPNGTGFAPVPLVSTDGQKVTVTLPPTGNDDVAGVNKMVRSLMSSLGNEFVWQYYELTGVQAIPTSDETTKDYYLANIVVESSQAGIQLFRGGLSQDPSFEPVPNIRNKINVHDKASGNTYSMGGCMGCHGAAQGEGGDFSFLLSTSHSGFNVDPIQENTLEAIKNATARRALIHKDGKFRY